MNGVLFRITTRPHLWLGILLSLLCPQWLSANESASPVPLPKHTSSPVYYPETALRKGAEGRVLLAFMISPLGRAINIVVESSEGDKSLKDGAVSVRDEV
jgi:outer membrane biosynthesis protein TonB